MTKAKHPPGPPMTLGNMHRFNEGWLPLTKAQG
jgi:hypothetical protein